MTVFLLHRLKPYESRIGTYNTSLSKDVITRYIVRITTTIQARDIYE